MDDTRTTVATPLTSFSSVFSGSYKDLLKHSGLSHFQFIILTIVIFLILSLVYLLVKLGLTQKVKFKHEDFPQSTLVYVSYLGPNHLISSTFSRVIQDTNTIFKFSESFAMYFEEGEPIISQSSQGKEEAEKKKPQAPHSSRAIFGIIVSGSELAKVSYFLEKHPKYHKSKVPKTKCLGTKYPYFNEMSFVAIVTRVYSKLSEHIKKHNLTAGPGVIEVYHMLGKDQHIRILTPLENFDQFKLWYQPEDQNAKKSN